MKKIFCTTSLALFSIVSHAECQVPTSLDGLTLENEIEPVYSSINPNAGAIARVTYGIDTYTARFINDQAAPLFKGLYVYRVIDKANGISLLYGYESKPFTKPSHTILFKCLTDDRGKAIFTQLLGKHEEKSRQNTITYTVLRD
ncbi:hypothetical protein [Photobacterium leiognathi]|uniref:hypothetical protein n=1 Tax=Photobacterium leiognathi TaxID=553611 RepID=UPI0027343C9F|nr:hypothetical protein [Photobacterium leiognathi]